MFAVDTFYYLYPPSPRSSCTPPPTPPNPLRLKRFYFMAPFFMDGVQLSQGYRATMGRQFTFYHVVLRNSWYSFDRPRKDERLSRPWSYLVVLNTGPLDWESSTLTTGPLIRRNFHRESNIKNRKKYFYIY